MELNAAVDRLNKEGFKPVDLCQVRRVQKSRLTNGKTWHGKGMFFFFRAIGGFAWRRCLLGTFFFFTGFFFFISFKKLFWVGREPRHRFLKG